MALDNSYNMMDRSGAKMDHSKTLMSGTVLSINPDDYIGHNMACFCTTPRHLIDEPHVTVEDLKNERL